MEKKKTKKNNKTLASLSGSQTLKDFTIEPKNITIYRLKKKKKKYICKHYVSTFFESQHVLLLPAVIFLMDLQHKQCQR